MESFKQRLDKLAQNVINYRGLKERYGSRQGWTSSILSVAEVISAIVIVITTFAGDFTGKIGVEIGASVLLIFSVLILSFFHLRDSAFNNGITAISLRRLERKLDRIQAVILDTSIKPELLEKEYEQMCDEYDKIELSNSTNSQYYQPAEKSYLSPYLGYTNPLPPATAPIHSAPPPPPPPPYNRYYPTDAPSYDTEHITIVTDTNPS